MKVTVTQQHINKGIPGTEVRCPIALALKDTGTKHLFVKKFYFETDKGIYRLPKAARDFVFKFDYKQEVAPFSFEAKQLI